MNGAVTPLRRAWPVVQGAGRQTAIRNLRLFSMKTTPLKLTATLPLLTFLLLPPLLPGATIVEEWAQRYNGPADSDDYAQAIAV